MRRSIVPLSLLVVAAVIWVLGIAGSAGAASRTGRILCPQANAHIVPCCPLPAKPVSASADLQPICCQATCCPSTGCCTPTPCGAPSLTISASPNPSIAGRKVVISGGFVGSPVSGAQVVLWRKPAGQSSFQQLAQTTTDSAGRYTFTLGKGAVMADQAWYVSANGVHSSTLQEHVDAMVGLASSARSTTVGRAVVLRGRVMPSHAGQTVLIERLKGGAWRVIARARLRKGSTYVVAHRFSQRGAVKLRTMLRGDSRNDKSISPTIALTVAP